MVILEFEVQVPEDCGEWKEPSYDITIEVGFESGSDRLSFSG
jgi:hypothetical protein